MKAFASWSGGKDCMLAVNRFLHDSTNSLAFLVNMCNHDGSHSRSHGIESTLVKEQANCLNMPIIQVATGRDEYRAKFKQTIISLKQKGVTAGIFGDIYLLEHRVWIEKLCAEVDIEPLFPLWGDNTLDLMGEFIDEGFKSMVISVNNTKLDVSWLGRVIDKQFISDITKLDGVDPCAENGEYHSFVFDGPLFTKPVSICKGERYVDNKHTFLEIGCSARDMGSENIVMSNE